MSTTRAKQHDISSVGFDCLDYIKFPSVTLSSTTQNNTVIAGRIYLPTAVKILRVIAGISGSVAGTVSLNIVSGTAAEVANSGATKYLSMPIPDTDYANQPTSPGAVAYPPAYATAGQKLFLADQALTITADTATVLTPSDSAAVASGAYAPGTPGSAWDSLWGPGGAEVTLRLPCSGATGLVEVGLLVKYYDPTYMKPILTGFNPATDLP
jgi:hypothetical protein